MVNIETKSNIVADGRHRLLKSEAYKEQKAAVISEVQAEFQGALAQSGLLKKAILRIQMYREIAKRLDRLAPKDASLVF